MCNWSNIRMGTFETYLKVVKSSNAHTFKRYFTACSLSTQDFKSTHLHTFIYWSFAAATSPTSHDGTKSVLIATCIQVFSCYLSELFLATRDDKKGFQFKAAWLDVSHQNKLWFDFHPQVIEAVNCYLSVCVSYVYNTWLAWNTTVWTLSGLELKRQQWIYFCSRKKRLSCRWEHLKWWSICGDSAMEIIA